MLNESFHYRSGVLYCDEIAVSEITSQTGTPVYIYSLCRILENLKQIQAAFGELKPHIHYSAKANANLTILKTLVQTGVGIDVVSGGEIFKALKAGARGEDIVFAGVGKTREEIHYALENNVGWFNVENVLELEYINSIATTIGRANVRVALRLNPDVKAPTHRHIATGHKGAKFGLPVQTVQEILANRLAYPHLQIEGIHIHIGSQLHDSLATTAAIETALECIAPYPEITTVNIGGGLAVRYAAEDDIPNWEAFGKAVSTLLKGYTVLVEPGRSVVADAGILVISVLYVKHQWDDAVLITDGSMTELIRPALYDAHHEIIPVVQSLSNENNVPYHIVGPVCESADALGYSRKISNPQPDDLLAVLTAGAYGNVMSSNYNQRPRPPEVIVEADGSNWQIARKRESWDDLMRNETEKARLQRK